MGDDLDTDIRSVGGVVVVVGVRSGRVCEDEKRL